VYDGLVGRWLSLVVLSGCDLVLRPNPAIDAPATAEDAAVDAVGPTLEGVVAWYPMELVDVNRVEDVSPQTHDAFCTSTACPGSSVGTIGGALRFDGAADFLTVESAADLEVPTAFTVGVHVQVAAPLPDLYACIASKRVGVLTNNSWLLCVRANSSILFETFHDDNGADFFEVVVPDLFAKPHHIAIRWDNLRKQIFVNGISVGERRIDSGIQMDQSPITIGAERDAILHYFYPGVLDELQIYNRALSDKEIADLGFVP
jgi:hypothetical protein